MDQFTDISHTCRRVNDESMDRYDRQVRIWGAEAQAELECARVGIFGRNLGDPLLQEVVKNLGLAGLGNLTLVIRDFGTVDNGGFFEDLSEVLDGLATKIEVMSWEEFLDGYRACSVVVTLNVEDPQEIYRIVAKRQEPLASAVVKGRSGLFQLVSLKEPHYILNTHPDYSIPYLRLDNPWPELEEFLESFDIVGLANGELLSQVPYPVILYHVLKFRPEGNVWGSKDVRQKIDELFPDQLDCLNVIEAKRSAHLALRTEEDEHREIMVTVEGLCRETIGREEWFDPCNRKLAVLCHCLKDYLSCNPTPVPRSLPDMESNTEIYGQLRFLFNSRHERDLANFMVTVPGIASPYGISEASVKEFFSNLNFLGCIRTCRLHEQFGKDHGFETLLEKAAEPNLSFISFHSSCFIGGLVSQEVIKLITHQYVPINNLYEYP